MNKGMIACVIALLFFIKAMFHFVAGCFWFGLQAIVDIWNWIAHNINKRG